MKQRIAITLLLCLALLGLPGSTPAHADTNNGPGPELGTTLPDPAIEPSDRECGLLDICTKKDPLYLSDLPGRFILVQMFSMYCPHCQASAKDVNALYQALQASPHAGQVTMVGLGAGNSRYEVDFYQDQFQVPFALFPDQDMAFYSCLEQPGTPFFIVLEKDAGTLRVRFEHQGPFGDPEEFLEQLFKALELEP